jgi:hypothetical protein
MHSYDRRVAADGDDNPIDGLKGIYRPARTDFAYACLAAKSESELDAILRWEKLATGDEHMRKILQALRADQPYPFRELQRIAKAYMRG